LYAELSKLSEAIFRMLEDEGIREEGEGDG
jgi:hypothetical protein